MLPIVGIINSRQRLLHLCSFHADFRKIFLATSLPPAAY